MRHALVCGLRVRDRRHEEGAEDAASREAGVIQHKGVPMKTALAVFVSVWVSAGPAWAGLGQPAASVLADQQRLRAPLRTMANDGYTVQQIEVADGTVVREYVSPAGLVFGVAWQGLKVPDLTQLLGAYFPVYQAAVPAPVRRRAPVVVHTEALVVEMSGHMRAFVGRAYVPSLVPRDVTPEVIQ